MTPETPKHKQIIEKPKDARRVLNLLQLKSKELPHASIVHITLWVPSVKVTDLVMELLFMGLDSLCMEDKSVAYAHTKDFGQLSRKQTDMPNKFQKVHDRFQKVHKD